MVFHPNVSPNGVICLDILKDKWSPAFTIGTLLIAITSLLTDPNPNDPLNVEAANLYKKSRREYEYYVREFTKKYAVN